MIPAGLPGVALEGAAVLASATETVISCSLLVAIPIAVLAGLVSFLSPCVLPLVPGYLSYMTGLTGAELAAQPQARSSDEDTDRAPSRSGDLKPAASDAIAAANTAAEPVAGTATLATGPLPPLRHSRVLLGTLLFVAGFSAVFVSYGALFGGLGSWLLEYQEPITRVLGVVVIVLGLSYMGVGRLARTFAWNRDLRIHRRPSAGLWGAPLLGVLFGLGWTPCIGPTLAAVQGLAFTEASAARGALLSLAYCIGLGLPFIVVGLGLRRLAGALAWTTQRAELIARIGGALLVVVGLLLVSGLWSDLVLQMQIWVSGFQPAL